LDVNIRLLQNNFRFKLQTRPLRLGDIGTIDYYWMDSAQLRKGTDAGLANFCACVKHWWVAVHAVGAQGELEQQVSYVLARCYPLISNSKSLQAIYLDAHIGRKFAKSLSPLPEATQDRIQEVTKRRDRFEFQEELDSVLGRHELPPRVLPLFQEAFRRWVGKGVVLLREGGDAGLERYLGEVDYWLCKFRRQSGEWVRTFINMFAYEAKVAFYRCYANAWIALIPWLCEHHGLDKISERFLRFWHNQNQPIELSPGRTEGGICYPTRGGAALMDLKDGKPVLNSIAYEIPQVGRTHVRDVFCGQVLSLHPLSAFFMRDPASCATAGRFFASNRFDDVMRRGDATLCSEYWGLLGAILTAAYRYRLALQQQFESRPVRASKSKAVVSAPARSSVVSERSLMEDLAVETKLRCPKNCNVPLRFESCAPPSKCGGPARANYRCPSCERPVSTDLDESAVRNFLME
jgi:hypothetical protein